MPTHLDPGARAPATASGAWKQLSAALTTQAADLAERDDLVVTCAPGAGGGAPGCYIPDRATIELDGTHLGCDPATCRPHRAADRARYPALWGVLCHEAAHAHHSRWSPDPAAPPAPARAALLLEESRVEAAHLARRPADAPWLRAAVERLLLEDIIDPDTGHATPPATVAEAAHAATLLLARADAGLLTRAETRPVAEAATTILGPTRLSALAALWHRAHACADDDAATMMELGRAWTTITTPTAAAGVGMDGAAALVAALDAAVAAVAATRPSPPASEGPASGRPPGAKTLPVFDAPPAREPVITGTRAPTPGEQDDARRLAQSLGRAAHREPVTTTTTAPVPPGRLRMRAVLARQAQQAAGALPTAEPFTRTRRRPGPRPPLRLGIACDVSGSMQEAVGPVASAAYTLARACTHLPPGSASATVAFNEEVHPVADPRHTPTRVTEFTASGFDEDLATATDALDHALGLARPGAARMLVIVSDGHFDHDRRARAQQRLDRLREAGCALVWLAIATRPDALDGCEVTVLDHAQGHRLPQVVGRAAARALAAA